MALKMIKKKKSLTLAYYSQMGPLNIFSYWHAIKFISIYICLQKKKKKKKKKFKKYFFKFLTKIRQKIQFYREIKFITASYSQLIPEIRHSIFITLKYFCAEITILFCLSHQNFAIIEVNKKSFSNISIKFPKQSVKFVTCEFFISYVKIASINIPIAFLFFWILMVFQFRFIVYIYSSYEQGVTKGQFLKINAGLNSDFNFYIGYLIKAKESNLP